MDLVDRLRSRGDWLGASCVPRLRDEGFVFAGQVVDDTLLVSAIGGKVEAGESFATAARREYHEEAGRRIGGFSGRHTTQGVYLDGVRPPLAHDVRVPRPAAALIVSRPDAHPTDGRLWIAVHIARVEQDPVAVEKIAVFVVIPPPFALGVVAAVVAERLLDWRFVGSTRSCERIRALIVAVNVTNAATRLPGGATVTAALARRDALGQRIRLVTDAANRAIDKLARFSRSEIREVAVLDVQALRPKPTSSRPSVAISTRSSSRSTGRPSCRSTSDWARWFRRGRWTVGRMNRRQWWFHPGSRAYGALPSNGMAIALRRSRRCRRTAQACTADRVPGTGHCAH